MPMRGLVSVTLIEIGGPELVVRNPARQHMIDSHEDGVGHRHHSLLVPAMAHDAPVTGSEPTLFGPNRCQCCFH